MVAGKLETSPLGPAEQPSPRGGGVVFRDLQDALRLHRWLVALCAAAGLLAGLLLFLLAAKSYHAEVLVIPAEDESQSSSSLLSGQLGGLAEMAGLHLGSSSNTWAGIATLQSRALADQFISSKNLMPELFHDDWDRVRGRWKPNVEQAPPSPWDAYELFDEKVRTVDYNSTTQLVTIGMDWRDPVTAATWANDYVRLANERLRQTAIKEAQSSVEVLRSEVEKADKVDLQLAIFRLIESNISRATLARVREEYAFKVIDRAVPSDPDEYVWPRPEIVMPVGLLLGFTLGFGIAVLRVVWSRTH
jgi:uncharacterized protein involved in exopolysaccharide biosynthesis